MIALAFCSAIIFITLHIIPASTLNWQASNSPQSIEQRVNRILSHTPLIGIYMFILAVSI
ncbi:hypothetical protein GLAREA_05907 [Glarea lozoyensis ATCC 20868]|uniref:Uncharacterized protein n=1 Tax=Glarea lozoyensis (strain ATCC 20868 / MF5171) TaxID=1116229 RepID=S3D545_GLAL2|nr:uncharacterized protein GLAREA_05907 [Glarea lozoyensis ATCC 20868]EPE32895.1 hypothetical protein GLAREA_05907 [Glarea lozoyensis ATCC 20868]